MRTMKPRQKLLAGREREREPDEEERVADVLGSFKDFYFYFYTR